MEALELVLFAVWCFLVALAGGLVGLVLGNIRLPATLLVASSPAAGGGANLAISAVAAGTASVAHLRAGRMNWRLFWWMAPPSIVGAVAGGLLAGEVPEDLLLGFIAAVLLYSAFDLSRWRPPKRDPDAPPTRETTRGPASGGPLATASPSAAASGTPGLDIRAAVLSGAVIGLLGGLVGLILGSLRMPALLRWVGETPQRAVGTNVTVGLLVGIAGALAHLPNAAPDLAPILVGGGASIPGAWLGARLTGRLSERQLVRAIAGVLAVAGIATAAQAVI